MQFIEYVNLAKAPDFRNPDCCLFIFCNRSWCKLLNRSWKPRSHLIIKADNIQNISSIV